MVEDRIAPSESGDQILKIRLLCVGLAAAGVIAAPSSQAAVTWTFNASATNVAGSSGTTTATATAFANTTGASISSGTVSSNNATLAAGSVWVYSAGLGVANALYGTGSSVDPNEGSTTTGEHAIDNNSNNSATSNTTVGANSAIYDSILLTFSSAVSLTGLKLGWSQFDTDVTISAYTGAGAPTLTGKTYAQLTANGWTYVEHEANVGTSSTRTFNGATTNPDTLVSTPTSSKYWLISAYNPTRGGDTSAAGLDVGNDYFKLFSVSATTSSPPPGPGRVPEPAGLALVAIAVAGAASTARKRHASKAN